MSDHPAMGTAATDCIFPSLFLLVATGGSLFSFFVIGGLVRYGRMTAREAAAGACFL